MSDQSTPSSDITSDDKLWALLAYILTPIVPIIILLMEDKKNRPFLKAHNMQALVLGGIYVISAALSSVVIGCVTTPLLFILFIVYGIKAYKGEYITVPVITDFVKKQGWA